MDILPKGEYDVHTGEEGHGLLGEAEPVHGIACSMSRRGNCHDNAVMEAFPFIRQERDGGSARQMRRCQNGMVVGQVSPAGFEQRALRVVRLAHVQMNNYQR
ncbi:MAG: hypothetical protein AB7P22_03635, partial [Vicinamibacterales bacterium]